MSAFIVTNTTIDHVVDAIYSFAKDRGRVWHQMPADRCSALDAIGQRLFNLNCEAVDQRYGERNDRPTYRHHPQLSGALHQFKAVECLLYQCSEGNVPETDLYKHLEDLRNALACRIAWDLCEARKVPWDFPERSEASVIVRIA